MSAGLIEMVYRESGETVSSPSRSLVSASPPPGSEMDTIIQSTLNAARRHLGMRVAYISRLEQDKSCLLYVDAPGFEALLKPGDVRPADEVYCAHALESRIPALLPDAACHPVARDVQMTHVLPVGACVSVPILSHTGDVIGLFCCLDPEANPSLNARDLRSVRLFADIAGAQLERKRERARQTASTGKKIVRMIERKEFSMVYQPLWNIVSGKIFGFECLARFPADPARDPQSWFEEADSVGMLVDLELALIRFALAGLEEFPPDIRLSINVSPATILDPRFLDTLVVYDVGRLVIELTEHFRVSDYDAVRAALGPLGPMGARVAVDDAGSGCASLQHIIGMNADLIKLDRSLVSELESSPASRAMIAALCHFGRETNCAILAEGIETRAEFEALLELGIEYGQGFLLGKPVSFKLAREMLKKANGLPRQVR